MPIVSHLGEVLAMNYRIELAEYQSDQWIPIAVVDKALQDLKTYLCIVKRMHPGSQVRALDMHTSQTVWLV